MIEELVLYQTLKAIDRNMGSAHINYVRLACHDQEGKTLSYKQTRDALYRVRVKGAAIQHIGKGVYTYA